MLLSLWAFCFAPLMASEDWPLLTSKDGGKTMYARPVAVEGELIRFEKKGGQTFKAAADKFSAKDHQRLNAWVEAMGEDLHREVVERVASATDLRILFIGNSYSFQIPKVFEALAKAEGKNLTVEQVTKGGCTLQRHAATPKTLERIAEGRWDLVVLQEQSLVPAILEAQRHRMMDPAAKTLVEAVRKAGAVPVFFLTWGRRDGDKMNAKAFPNDTFDAMQARLVTGYGKASKFAGGQAGGVFIVPVGQVWSDVRKLGKDENLYTKDGSHPGKRGIYLASCVFYSALYDQAVATKTSTVKQGAVLAETAQAARMKPVSYPVKSK